MKYFLDLEIARSSTSVILSHRCYALQLLEDAGFLASKLALVPMDHKLQVNSTYGDLLSDPSSYRRLIGRLFYLTLFRPGITFAVKKLSQFLSQPRSTYIIIFSGTLYLPQAKVYFLQPHHPCRLRPSQMQTRLPILTLGNPQLVSVFSLVNL